MRQRALGAGIAGGMLAGALVGAVEAAVSWAGAHGAGEMPAVGWAVIAYGAVGGLAGLGVGVLAALLGTDGFGLALGGVLAVLGFTVARFRIVRDVFLEQPPHGPVATAVQAGAALATLVLAIVVWRALRGADARRRLLTRPLVVAVVLAVVGVGWILALRTTSAPTRVAATRGTAPAGAPNVVLLMLDTVRADHLSAYGYGAGATPRMDALAADGIRFANAFSQASWTRPSVATILTGMYPSSHGAVHKADALPDRNETIAEVLATRGYYTVGFANNANVAPAFNFGQGFADYRYLAPDLFFRADEPAAQLTMYNVLRLVRERFVSRFVDVHHYYQPAEVVTSEAVRWLGTPEAGQGPFFLFLHYMDAHDPYMVHPFDGEGYARVANPNPPPDLADKLRRLYDGEIAYMDGQLGVLFDELKRRNLYDKTLIVLTADHGEEFHEHGGWWHGTTLYDEQTHVPLIVKPPAGGARGRVVDELATSLDILPTIATAASAAIPAAAQGHALPLDAAPAAARESVFSETDLEGNALQSIRSPRWKYVKANPDNPRGLAPEELYDLQKDPGEHANQAGAQAQQKLAMEAALGKAFTEARKYAGAASQTNIDEATRSRLEALGYMEKKK